MCEQCAKRRFTKEQMAQMKLASECGLAFGGVDDEGELQFVGSIKEWTKFDKKLSTTKSLTA